MTKCDTLAIRLILSFKTRVLTHLKNQTFLQESKCFNSKMIYIKNNVWNSSEERYKHHKSGLKSPNHNISQCISSLHVLCLCVTIRIINVFTYWLPIQSEKSKVRTQSTPGDPKAVCVSLICTWCDKLKIFIEAHNTKVKGTLLTKVALASWSQFVGLWRGVSLVAMQHHKL